MGSLETSTKRERGLMGTRKIPPAPTRFNYQFSLLSHKRVTGDEADPRAQKLETLDALQEGKCRSKKHSKIPQKQEN